MSKQVSVQDTQQEIRE